MGDAKPLTDDEMDAASAAGRIEFLQRPVQRIYVASEHLAIEVRPATIWQVEADSGETMSIVVPVQFKR